MIRWKFQGQMHTAQGIQTSPLKRGIFWDVPFSILSLSSHDVFRWSRKPPALINLRLKTGHFERNHTLTGSRSKNLCENSQKSVENLCTPLDIVVEFGCWGQDWNEMAIFLLKKLWFSGAEVSVLCTYSLTFHLYCSQHVQSRLWLLRLLPQVAGK